MSEASNARSTASNDSHKTHTHDPLTSRGTPAVGPGYSGALWATAGSSVTATTGLLHNAVKGSLQLWPGAAGWGVHASKKHARGNT